MPFKNIIYLDKNQVIKPVPDTEEDTAKCKIESYSLGIGKREWEIKVRQTWIKTLVQPLTSCVTTAESHALWPSISTDIEKEMM